MFNNNEINQIKRSESRKYFEDVLQSYYSKNYRAAILLLYNVTIDDLYNKLLLMNERKYFNLSQELKKIDELSKNDSKYSEVEAEIYKIYKDKNILNHDTMDALEFFKKVRNKCAHPSFFKGENYSPYPEEVYMIMKRVYQDILGIEVFIKDPYELVKDDIESKEWGNITDIIMGFKKHEENYAIFSQYFTNKYLEKFTDNNFEKLFHTLIKLIIIKKDNWTIVNQYKNMMLMESLIDYLNKKGRINILYNKYDWANLTEENLIDDNNEEIYEREWFALTNLYKIVAKVPCFINEIKSQNEIVYSAMKGKIFNENEYIVNYWNIFYNEFSEVIPLIENKNMHLYQSIIENIKILGKDQKIKVMEKMFKSIPVYNGFDKANTACTILITQIKQDELKTEDLEGILELMNNNSQIYSKSRGNSEIQIRTIKSLGISLRNYTNLKNLVGE